MMAPRVFRSFQKLTGTVCQTAQTLTSLFIEPSQVNLRPSNWASLLPNSGSVGMPRPTLAMTVPSCGRLEYTSFVRIMLPAPGRFFTIMRGLPGMFRPM